MAKFLLIYLLLVDRTEIYNNFDIGLSSQWWLVWLCTDKTFEDVTFENCDVHIEILLGESQAT